VNFKTHRIGVLAMCLALGATARAQSGDQRGLGQSGRSGQSSGQSAGQADQMTGQHDAQRQQHDQAAGQTTALTGMNPVQSAQDAAQARKLMDTNGISLGDAIRAAEQHSNGKAVFAQIVMVRGQSGQSGQSGALGSSGQGNPTDLDAGGMTGQQSGQQRPTQGHETGRPQPGHTGQSGQSGQMGQSGQSQSGGALGQAGGQINFVIHCVNAQNQLTQVTVDGQKGQVRDAHPATAIQIPRGGMSGMSGAYATNVRFLSANDVMGADVKSLDGENLGNIINLAIDGEDGRIAYAVLSFGGVMGIGSELHAVPWTVLRARGSDQFSMNADRETVRRSQGFDNERWPRTADTAWRTRTQQDEFRPAGMEERQPATFTYKGSNLTGKPVLSQQGEKIATITDLALDPQSGKVAYAIVSYGGVAGMGGEKIPVPWQAFDQSSKEGFTLRADRSVLETAPKLEGKDLSRLADRDLALRIAQAFNVQPYSGAGTDMEQQPQQRRGVERENYEGAERGRGGRGTSN
jgi:sporulation protein YlmC with PRC-barrel domain